MVLPVQSRMTKRSTVGNQEISALNRFLACKIYSTRIYIRLQTVQENSLNAPTYR